MNKADIGMIGLAVMGQNLVLNMNDHGYKVAAINLVGARASQFLQGAARGRDTIYAADTIEELIGLLDPPRKIMLMIRAGNAVDQTIEKLLPYLEKGDLIIDGGNSFYKDTMRRMHNLSQKGIHYIGAGISGGEEGARHGSSIMAGGEAAAWPLVKDIFLSIAAQTKDGSPCCDWVGESGAGFFNCIGFL